jgi:HAE1 family hydrophobic/amphiphilic exporter-1
VAKHAAEPDSAGPADDVVPDSSGGAHEALEPAKSRAEPPSGALRGYTDQFEVLKLPRRPSTPSS